MDGVLVKKQQRKFKDGWNERYFRFTPNDRKLQYWKDEQEYNAKKNPRGAIIVQKLYQLPERDGAKQHRLDVQGRSVKDGEKRRNGARVFAIFCVSCPSLENKEEWASQLKSVLNPDNIHPRDANDQVRAKSNLRKSMIAGYDEEFADDTRTATLTRQPGQAGMGIANFFPGGGRPETEVMGLDDDDSGDEYIEEVQDSLSCGDIVYLECEYPSKRGVAPVGYLHGDGVCRTRVGTQPLKGRTAPRNFQECLFRITPPLLYEASSELQEVLRARPEPVPALKPNEKLDKKKKKERAKEERAHAERMADFEAATKELRTEIDREKQMNLETLHKINSAGGDRVLYGQRVQLQHVRSGKFVTVRRTQAQKQQNAIQLALTDHGNQYSIFRLDPHFRNRVEGGKVYYNDQIKLESCQVANEYIHSTNKGFDEREGKKDVRIREVNLEAGTGWKLLKYKRPSDPEFDGLCTNQPVRLYHADAQGFIAASADATKEGHKAYLRHVPEGEPHQRAHHSGKQIWTFENVDRRSATVLKWSQKAVRVKHLPTRKYLAIELKQTSSEKKKGMFCSTLVEDEGAATNFRLVPDEIFKADVIPSHELSFRLQHTITEGPHEGRVAWLHNSHLPKEKKGKRNVDSTRTQSLQLHFSLERRAEDTIMLLPCDPEEGKLLETVRSMVKVAETYRKRMEEARNGRAGDLASRLQKELHTHALAEIRLMLETAIKFVTEFDEQSGHEVDPLTIEGPPRPYQQKLACDLKLVNRLFDIVQSIVNSCPASEWNVNEDPAVNTQGPAAYVLGKIVAQRPRWLYVHKLAFHAMVRIFHDNSAVQNYFGKQTTMIPKRVVIPYHKPPDAADSDDEFDNPMDMASNLIGGLGGKFDGMSSKLGGAMSSRMKGLHKVKLSGGVGDAVSKGAKIFSGIGDGMRAGLSAATSAAGDATSKMKDAAGNMTSKIKSAFDAEDSMARPLEEQTFIAAVIRQINAGQDVGAAACLRRLIDNNVTLLDKTVNQSTIENFVSLIQDRGPRPEYLRFFSATCNCRQQAVISNQECCLEVLWMNSDNRKDLVLETKTQAISPSGEALEAAAIPELEWSAAAKRNQLIKAREKELRNCGEAPTTDFLGFKERTEGFPLLCVKWNRVLAGKAWCSRREVHAVNKKVPAKAFDLGVDKTKVQLEYPGEEEVTSSVPVQKKSQVTWVPVKNLCWVLDPQYMFYEIFVAEGEWPVDYGNDPKVRAWIEAANNARNNTPRPEGSAGYDDDKRAQDYTNNISLLKETWEHYARGYLLLDPVTLEDIGDDLASGTNVAAANNEAELGEDTVVASTSPRFNEPETIAISLDDGPDETKDDVQSAEKAPPVSKSNVEAAVESSSDTELMVDAAKARMKRSFFHAQLQLAQYYLAQIQLFSELCLDRNYHAILKLENVFSYELLVSAMANHKLPFRLRAGFTRLLLRLYVDRYPQQHIQMPRLIHVLKKADRDSSGAPVVIQKGNKGVIHADDEKALPYFELDKSNKYVQQKDAPPHYTFRFATKFRLVREFVEAYFERTARVPSIVSRENKNEFTLAVIEMLKSLIRFGFFDTIKKLQALIDPLIQCMDGRMDSLNAEMAEMGVTSIERKKWASEKRYMLSEEHNDLMMKVKTELCNVLTEICNVRADFRLTMTMELFKKSLIGLQSKLDKKTEKGAVKIVHYKASSSAMSAMLYKEKGKRKVLTDQTRKDIDKLFTSKDAQHFDLEKLTCKPLVTILLDLMNYEDSDLFEAAFGLLVRRNGQKKKLMQAMDEAVVLQTEKLIADHGTGISQKHPVNTLPQLEEHVASLRKEVNEWELWSKVNEVGGIGEVGHTTKIDVDACEGLETLDMFCVTESDHGHSEYEDESKSSNGSTPMEPIPNHQHQALLRDLNAHGIFLKALNIPLERVKKHLDEESEEQKQREENKKELHLKQQEHKGKGGSKQRQEELNKRIQELEEIMREDRKKTTAREGYKERTYDECVHDAQATYDALHKVIVRSTKALTSFVAGNPKNQAILFDQLGMLQQKLEAKSGETNADDSIVHLCAKLVSKIFLGNDRLSEQAPESLFQISADLLQQHADSDGMVFLEFFEAVVLEADGDPISRNQRYALDAISDTRRALVPDLSSLKKAKITDADSMARAAKILGVLAMCAEGDNTKTNGQLQALLPHRGMNLESLLRLIEDILTALLQDFFDREEVNQGLHRRGSSTISQSAGTTADFMGVGDGGASPSSGNARSTSTQLVELVQRHRKQAWELLSELTALLTHVYCDTLLVDYSFIDSAGVWGTSESGGGLFPKLLAVISEVNDAWWPREGGLGPQAGRGQQPEACAYVADHALPMLRFFFEKIWGQGDVASTRIQKIHDDCMRLMFQLATADKAEGVFVEGKDLTQREGEGPDDVRHLRAKALKVFAATNQVNDDLSEEEYARFQKARTELQSVAKSSFMSKSRKSFRGMSMGQSSKHIAVNKQAALQCWDDPCTYWNNFKTVACHPDNWLNAKSKEDFDDFVKQLAYVEERTSGEPGAGVPRPSAASKGTFGVSMDIKNLKNVNVLDIAASAASTVTSAAAALQETAFGPGQAHILGAKIREIDEDVELHPKKGRKAETHKVLYRRIKLQEMVSRISTHLQEQLTALDATDSFEEECVLFDLLRRIVGRWRERNHTNLEYSDEERQIMFHKRQEELNEWGCTDLVLTAISSAEMFEHIPFGKEVFEHALHFGEVLLEGGCKAVQRKMFARLQKGEDEGFFRHIVHQIRLQAENLHRSREDAAVAADDDDDEDLEQMSHAQKLANIFKFLQFCCEGHYLDMQKMMCEQEGSTKTFDLIQEAITILVSEAKTTSQLAVKPAHDLDIIISLMNFLTEVMEGPCESNQAAIASSGVPDAIIRVMRTHFRIEKQQEKDGGAKVVAELRSATTKMTSAMLEGRQQDRSVHTVLLDKLGATTVKNGLQGVYTRIENIDKKQHKYSSKMSTLRDFVCRRSGKSAKRAGFLEEERVARLDEGFELFSTAMTLCEERPTLSRELQPSMHVGDKQYAKAYAFMSDRFRHIEVYWHGAVQRIFFQMPETERLAEVRMKELIEGVDLGAGRLVDFVTRAGHLGDEMNHLATQSNSAFMGLFKTMFFEFKYANYFLVFLLNIIVIGCIKAGDGGGEDLYLFDKNIHFQPAGAKTIFRVLLIAIGSGYVLLMAYMLLSHAPLTILAMRRRRIALADNVTSTEETEEEEAKRKRIASRTNCCSRLLGCFLDYLRTFGNWNAFLYWALSAFAYVVILIGLMGRQDGGFKDDVMENFKAVAWFLIFGAVVFGPWLLKCLRSFWSDKLYGLSSIYCILWDVMTPSSVLTHLFLALLAVLSWFHWFFATMMLVDIVSFNDTLGNVVLAAAKPYKQLLMTFALFLMVILIYTSVGMYYFGDLLQKEGELEMDGNVLTKGPATSTCPDLLQCFVSVAHFGVRTPDDIGMDDTGIDEELYSARVAFDLTFFIILGALLFNMVTGIIVDTFGELREASKERAEQLANVCFICNTERSVMDDMGAEFDYDTHTEKEHNMWNYVYYINYLSRKSPLDYNGVEMDISEKIKVKDTTWFPNRKWLKLQAMQFEKANENEEEHTVDERLTKVDESLLSLTAHLEEIKTTLEDHEDLHNENRAMLAAAAQKQQS